MQERLFNEHIKLAHKMIDSGADIIHGHSGHIFQGIEIYKNKSILYDTGEFVDDYVVDTNLRNDISFLFILKVSKKAIKNIELIPIKISFMRQIGPLVKIINGL